MFPIFWITHALQFLKFDFGLLFPSILKNIELGLIKMFIALTAPRHKTTFVLILTRNVFFNPNFQTSNK